MHKHTHRLPNHVNHPLTPAPQFNKGDLVITQVPLNSAFPRHFIPKGMHVTVADVHPANGHYAYLVLDNHDNSALVDETALAAAESEKVR